MSFDRIDREAQDWLETQLLPLEVALEEMPALRATPEGATRIRNGNPGQVNGRYRGGLGHPDRVFNLP